MRQANAPHELTCFKKPASDVAPCAGASESEPLDHYYGCVDERGQEVVPFVHRRPIFFAPSGFAVVLERFCARDGGWYYVDTTYQRKLKAVTMEGIPDAWLPADSSPDPTRLQTMVRYEEGGKFGYLDLRSGVVTGPIYGSAWRFVDGAALVCVGCHPERWNQCAPSEAHCTGEAYLINEAGERLGREPDRRFHEYWWCREHPGEQYVPPADPYCQ